MWQPQKAAGKKSVWIARAEAATAAARLAMSRAWAEELPLQLRCQLLHWHRKYYPHCQSILAKSERDSCIEWEMRHEWDGGWDWGQNKAQKRPSEFLKYKFKWQIDKWTFRAFFVFIVCVQVCVCVCECRWVIQQFLQHLPAAAWSKFLLVPHFQAAATAAAAVAASLCSENKKKYMKKRKENEKNHSTGFWCWFCEDVEWVAAAAAASTARAGQSVGSELLRRIVALWNTQQTAQTARHS